MPTVTRIKAKLHSPAGKQVAAYTRVSGAKDAQLNSLAAQTDYFTKLITNNPLWVFGEIYIDEAKTGTLDDRPAFQRMLADCRDGKIDIVLTKSISRFARNTVTLLETTRELKNLGIDVYFERERIHSINSEGELMLSLLAAFAQEESRSVSENCKWRIRKTFMEGKATPHKMLGYTYKDGLFSVKEEEREVVQYIFGSYLSGMGKESISNKLKTIGINITPNGVMKILYNEKYVGDMLLQKTHVPDHMTKRSIRNSGVLPMYAVTDSHEPLVERTMAEAVQAEAARRAAKYQPIRRAPVRHELTGMIRCDICGATYRHKMADAGTKHEKPAWICGTYNRYGKAACASQQIPEAVLIEKTEETLGKPFNELRKIVKEIRVPAHNRLVFVFPDDSTIAVKWRRPSRRDSWTPEMREAARRKGKKCQQCE
ncbi:hypothetical protein FACS1894184_16530 [Clostridia bacterium]|nr:hypothetical protein FACS1894184_16530 [Clostridia bacterium]